LKSKQISLGYALLPILILVILLSYNVIVFGDDALSGSNQFILLLGGAVAAIVGFKWNISYEVMLKKVAENLQSVTGALLILFLSAPWQELG
jgi:NhaC family Na+:H+ antiporter